MSWSWIQSITAPLPHGSLESFVAVAELAVREVVVLGHRRVPALAPAALVVARATAPSATVTASLRPRRWAGRCEPPARPSRAPSTRKPGGGLAGLLADGAADAPASSPTGWRLATTSRRRNADGLNAQPAGRSKAAGGGRQRGSPGWRRRRPRTRSESRIASANSDIVRLPSPCTAQGAAPGWRWRRPQPSANPLPVASRGRVALRRLEHVVRGLPIRRPTGGSDSVSAAPGCRGFFGRALASGLPCAPTATAREPTDPESGPNAGSGLPFGLRQAWASTRDPSPQLAQPQPAPARINSNKPCAHGATNALTAAMLAQSLQT